MPDPPPVSYSDKVGYKDNVDDIEALASKALSPISDFPPGADYDDDHSISSDDDDDDMSLSDEEGQRDATALRKKTSDILNDFEGFVKDVNKSSSASMEIMNTLTGTNNVRGADTVKSRITSGGGDAALNREWSHEERNLHDVRFGSDDDYSSGGGYNKYEKRRFFKYAIPFFHSKKFKAIATGVAAVLILVVIVGTMGKAGDREDVGELNSVVMVEDVATVSIDTSTCEDHPTAKITPDGHTCEDFIAHVGRVNLHNARCSHLTTLTNEKGVPLFVKDVCRLSCGVCGDAWTAGEQKQEDAGLPQDQAEIVEPAIQQSTPVTLDNDSSSPVTECKDDLTKVVAIGGKTCETYFSDLTMEHLMELRCSHQTDIKSDLGNNFLLVKEICKQTCGLCSVTGQIMDESSTETQTEENSVDIPASFTIEPEASSTVSIDESTCEDNPTAIITTDGHTCEDFIAHVGRVPLHNARCSHESPVKNERGEPLLVKEVCRLSCGMCGDAWTATEGQQKQEDAGMPQSQSEGNGFSSGAFATETEAPKPEPSATVSIDSSTCADDPTAIITTDGHTCEDFIAHVGRVPLHNARCSHESPVKTERGESLLVKEVCRLSCGMCGDVWTATEGAKEDTGVPQAQTEGNGFSSGAAVTGTEAPKPEPSATVSIDSSTCADDPTAIITTDGHTCEDFIAHVGRVPLHNARCSHESPVKNERGEPMLVKEVCRLSCGMCGDVWTATEGPKEDTGVPQAQTEVLEPSIQEPTVQESHDEMTNWMTPVTLNNEPEPSSTVSIDSSTCADDPTAIITTDGHTCEDFIAHVGRVPLHNARCSHESPVKNERGEPLLVKEVCRLSCGMCGDAWTATEGAQVDSGKPPVQEPVESVPPPSSTMVQVESETTEDTVSNTNNLSIQSKPASVSGAPEQQAYNYVANRYAPLWFDRSFGWEGTTYEAAVQFCLSLQQNRILCPYEAYCPMGPNSAVPFGGFRDGNSWVPAINSSEGWIRVGNSENTCKHAKFGDDWGQDGSNEEQTRNIMCCLYEKPEG